MVWGWPVVFRVIAELAPSKRLRKLLERANQISRYVDAIDIPDAPLGLFYGSASIIAVLLHDRLGIPVIPHIRLNTYMLDGVINLIVGLDLAGINEVVLLRGDPPRLGRDSELETTHVLSIAKKYVPHLQYGGLISLRYPVNEVVKRLNEGFDFFLVLRYSGKGEKIGKIVKEARTRRKALYPYLIVATSRNADLVARNLSGQPFFRVNELTKIVGEATDLFNGIIISCPGDHEGLVQALRLVKSIVG